MLFIQLGVPDVRTGSLINVASNWIGQRFFDQLRTKQQLGYIVSASTCRILHTVGFSFVVQSTMDPSILTERITEFVLDECRNAAGALTDKEFDLHREASIAILSQKPKRLSEEASKNFAEIALRRYEFNRREKQVEILRSLPRDEFVTFVQTRMQNPSWLVVELKSALSAKEEGNRRGGQPPPTTSTEAAGSQQAPASGGVPPRRRVAQGIDEEGAKLILRNRQWVDIVDLKEFKTSARTHFEFL